MRSTIVWLSLGFAFLCRLAAAQEIPAVAGWRTSLPTPGTHRIGIDLSGPRSGKGSGKIVATCSEKEMPPDARACFTQEFYGKTAIKPGRTYRYSLCYRTETPLEGWGSVLIDSYTKEGEKSHRGLVSQKLAAAGQWQTVAGEVAVPEDAVRVRMLLYLHGRGTIWYDDAFFGDPAPEAPNLLANGGFEPPACYVYDLAPEKPSGNVKFFADFDNATLGKVKQLGPDEFYLYALPQDQPHSPFLWFHFRVEGCQDRELTFHVNPAPFSQDNTGGNGTRLPVMSYDGDRWAGIEDKSWNEDGSVLTFKQHFTQSPAWIASFFPYTDEHVTRFIESHKGSPSFQAGVVGKTKARPRHPPHHDHGPGRARGRQARDPVHRAPARLGDHRRWPWRASAASCCPTIPGPRSSAARSCSTSCPAWTPTGSTRATCIAPWETSTASGAWAPRPRPRPWRSSSRTWRRGDARSICSWTSTAGATRSGPRCS